MTEDDFVAAQRRIDDYFGCWWRLASTSFAARVTAAPEISREALGDDPLLGQLVPDAKFFLGIAATAARESFTLSAMQSLAAVRRWTLERGGPPSDLAAATAAAGFPDTPRDPFAAAPLKLTFTAGSPLIYSIGPDHRDDGGKVDARLDSRRRRLAHPTLPRAARPMSPRKELMPEPSLPQGHSLPDVRKVIEELRDFSKGNTIGEDPQPFAISSRTAAGSDRQ